MLVKALISVYKRISIKLILGTHSKKSNEVIYPWI
jgi:hypothetical protein